MQKNKVLRIFLIMFILLGMLLYSGCVLANEQIEINENTKVMHNENYSRAYLEYLELSDEEKSKLEVIPRKYNIPLDSIYEDTIEVKENPSIFNLYGLKAKSNIVSAYSDELPERFDLRDKIDIPSKNQGAVGLCWAFASIRSLETNLALNGYGNYDFSELHTGYFAVNGIEYPEKLEIGGYFENFKSYCGNLQGPVLEEEVPYNYKYNNTIEQYDYLVNLSSKAYLVDTIDFPTIDKVFGSYTDEELTLFRDKVKKHIIENGSIYICIHSESIEYINNYWTIYNTTLGIDHAISVIGWDDNFSKENFRDKLGNMPSKDGAYIALNSWGENTEIIYISYEDATVEREMSGVVVSTINKEDAIHQVKFNDQNLYQAIKEELEECIFTYDDENLTIDILTIEYTTNILDLSNRNITNIIGLKDLCNYINIVKLDLSNNQVVDLYNLPNIGSINLSNNNIESIPDLSNLDNLWDINLSNNPMIDMSNLPNVGSINLSNNNIETLPDLSYLSNLRYLYLNDNNIEVIPEVHIQTDGEEGNLLDLSNNRIKDFSNLPNVGSINLSNNNIEEIPDFSHLDKVWEINLSNNFITDINNLPNICSINLSNNNIEEIPDFSHLDKVWEINLSNNFITDISNLPNIDTINLSNNDIEVIPNLSHLNRIYSLNLSNNLITDISNLPNASIINLSNNNIEVIPNLSHLNRLYSLNLSNNSITDISNLPNIDTINLSNNNIEEIPDLSYLDRLREIDLSNNRIKDFSNLPNVNSINISNNNIEVIPKFSHLDRLYSLNLSNNKIANMPENFKGIFGKQTATINIDLEKDKENKIPLYNLIYKTYFMKHRAEVNIETENCNIDYKNKEIIINPTTLGEGKAVIRINGGDFDGTVYNINYNAKEEIEFSRLEIKNMPNNLAYLEGENFEQDGLQVYGIINENQYIINDYSVLDGENLKGEQEYVTVKYQELEIQVPVTVYSNDEIIRLEVLDEKIIDEIMGWRGAIFRRDGPCSVSLLKEEIVFLNHIYLPSDIENISGLESLENLQQISLNRSDYIKTEEDRIELPKYIYQLLTLWSGNSAEAIIYYDTYYYDTDEEKWPNINYNENKKTVDVEMDYENEKAYITVDREIKQNNVVRGGPAGEEIKLDNVRCVEVKITGKINGPTYKAFYKTEKLLNRIDVTQAPNKTSYIEGENFDSTNMIITATYNDGTTQEITEGYVCTPETLNTAGEQEITVTYGGKTTTFNVTVVKKGDVNGDSQVNFMDILIMNNHRLGKIQLTGIYLQAADVTGDGLINFMDILQVNRYRLGKINSL